MESEVTDARRAIEFVERKLQEKDVKGAIKFARGTQNMFPQLKRLFKFLGDINVHVYDQEIAEEIDWYSVLPLADTKLMRQHYSELAMALHPGINEPFGSIEAYHILNKAWSILSDKFLREAYNIKRRSSVIDQNALVENPAVSTAENSSLALSNIRTTAILTHQPTSSGVRDLEMYGNPQRIYAHQQAPTFWTACHNCRTQYQYLRYYINQYIICNQCRRIFPAIEAPGPQVIIPYSNFQAFHAPRPSNTFLTDRLNVQPRTHNVTGNIRSGSAVFSSATQLGNQTTATREKAPDNCSEQSGTGTAPGSGSTVKDLKLKEKMISGEDVCARNVAPNHVAAGSGVNVQGGVDMCQKGNSQAENVGVSGSRESKRRKTSADIKNRSLLADKARSEILKKLNEWKVADRSNKEGDSEILIENPRNAADNMEIASTKGSGEDIFMTMPVPDSDFHDFDKDRIQTSFGENQVWAAYDDDDGMPRLYALIRKVTRRPFKLEISWLNSRSNTDLAPIDWITCGFSKTCGEFRIGKKETSNRLNSFSHRVIGWSKAAGAIRIFPKKTDIWALYRNWSPNWNTLTPDDERHAYEMVEILEDYNEERGVTVVHLTKVAGFRSVFRSAQEVRTIPKAELFRFSHQVCSHLLMDPEAPEIPEGSKELDPAALPPQLLQVAT